ncbi:MAG: hypothetical protein ACR2RE_30110 [Geminicoccaceae bacterium]
MASSHAGCYSFEVQGVGITYRLLTPSVLLIMLIRRFEGQGRLRSGLSCLTWFGRFLTSHDLGVRWVCGCVDTSPYRSDGGISDDQLRRFYVDFLGCEPVGADEIPGLDQADVELTPKKQTKWVHLDLAHFVEPRLYLRSRLKERKPSFRGS